MTVVQFRHPEFIHVRCRCRRCRDYVLVTLGFGATEPREGFYVCSTCHTSPPVSLVLVEDAPQLRLEDDCG